jgi:hypothetical protein
MTNRNRNKLRLLQDLEHRILHGLACEWRSASYMLPEPRERMRPPLFRLGDMKSRLGYWSGDKQEICISRHLVDNHSWGDVREVLLHEMAHQYVDQVLFREKDSRPHGALFQKACHLLRADPKASGHLDFDGNSPIDKAAASEVNMIRRIRKLMALAESRNANEAEAAMAKAHDLIMKYNIDSLASTEPRDFISTFVGKPTLRHPRQDYYLATILRDFYFVEGVWVTAYVLEKGKMGRVLEISGTPHNVDIARYIHSFVEHYIHSQWLQYSKDRGLNHHRKTDFAIGILEGFTAKLSSQQEQQAGPTGSFAVVTVKDPQLEAYVDYRYPHTTTLRRAASIQDERVIIDGMLIGEKMIISKAITEKKTDGTLLIDY